MMQGNLFLTMNESIVTTFAGYYLYIETSSPRQFGEKAVISTPYLNGPQCMTFSHNMYGIDIGQLNVYANNQKIYSESGDQGKGWVQVTMPISQQGRYMVSKIDLLAVTENRWK